MHNYPAWRIWLVFVALVLGLLLALPNFFGDAPALQLSRNDRTAVGEAGQQQALATLQSKNVPVESSYLEEDRLVLRFHDVDAQLKARDAVQEALGREYLPALSHVPRTPAWMRALSLQPMSLGLDLRGGVYFLYEVDVKGAVTQLLAGMERDYRQLLRNERIPFTGIAHDNVDTVRITLRDGDEVDRVAALLRRQDVNSQIDVNSLGEGGSVTVKLAPAQISQRQDFAIQQNITTLRNRVDELGVTEPIVTRQGKDRIVVQLPGVQDPNEALRVLGATATLEFRLVDDQNDPLLADQNKRAPLGTRLYHDRSGRPVLLKREVIASGEQLTDASSGFNQGEPAVYVTLDARGAAQMLDATRENLGKPMAVVFIEKKRVAEGQPCNGTRVATECTTEEVISVATIRGVFISNFQITGVMANEARELALLLRAGSLAAPLYIVEQRTIGPSLGQDNVERGFKALVIGLIGMFIFLVLYYRAFGLVACVVLLSNMVLLVALMSLLQAALSLPGIAGIVLTIGMAADANVLIFERIREELRNGNSPHAAINAGFEKAFSAIADSNVTTLIAGIVLFTFGTGPVRGFAVTLCLGILTSLFTAILGSRAYIQLIWGRQRRLASLPI
ncbi:MAG: protein-export rane protein SecD/SecF family [Steroidobacteraceae bacterium]|nr:protein-export rane protein SecD/SecF family [Steroidobacteraceae bacterium]